MKNNNLVYKYRSGGTSSADEQKIFERDLKSLKNNEIYAPTIETLNDPCEGFVNTDILIEQINEMIKINPQAMQSKNIFKNELQNMLSHTETSGIYSLSKNYLDELLWAHYANSHKGFCIEYDLNLLLKLNHEMVFQKKELLVFDVKYNDKPYHLTASDMNNLKSVSSFMNKLLGYKSSKWKYEGEIRIICPQSGAIKYDYRAVKSIYFGLRMEEEQENQIMEALQGRGVRYFKIKLKNNSYGFYSEPIEDSYIESKKYSLNIAPIPEYIINHTNYKTNHNIRKAIEIVRREPDCNLILNVIENKSDIEVVYQKEHTEIFKPKYTFQEKDIFFN